jgi:hypothetical protein
MHGHGHDESLPKIFAGVLALARHINIFLAGDVRAALAEFELPDTPVEAAYSIPL